MKNLKKIIRNPNKYLAITVVSLATVIASQASTACVFALFYEPTIPSILLKKN
jgi:cyclic lactone autoinducer peptide